MRLYTNPLMFFPTLLSNDRNSEANLEEVKLLEKAEVQEKSSADSQKPITGETPPQGSQPPSDQMEESLKILSEETLQLSEFLWQEEKLINELCALLKLVLKQVNVSFNLPANILPHTEKMQRIMLNDEAHLILINDQNEVRSKALEDYPPQIVFNVISFVVPELGRSLTSFRKRISVRISLFDRVNQELRNLRNIFASSPKKLGDSSPVDDGVKKALLSRKEESGGQ